MIASIDPVYLKYWFSEAVRYLGLLPNAAMWVIYYLMWYRSARLSTGHYLLGFITVVWWGIINLTLAFCEDFLPVLRIFNYPQAIWGAYHLIYLGEIAKAKQRGERYIPQNRLMKILAGEPTYTRFWFRSAFQWAVGIAMFLLTGFYFIGRVATAIVETQKIGEKKAAQVEAKVTQKLTSAIGAAKEEVKQEVTAALDTVKREQDTIKAVAVTAKTAATTLKAEVKKNQSELASTRRTANQARTEARRARNSPVYPVTPLKSTELKFPLPGIQPYTPPKSNKPRRGRQSVSNEGEDEMLADSAAVLLAKLPLLRY